jgi:hypothetical protein
MLSSSLNLVRWCGYSSAEPVSDMPAPRPPAVPRAERLPVRPLVERLAVVRAGFGLSLLLCSGSGDGVGSDGDELFPGDDSSPPSASRSGQVSGASASDQAPPTTDAPAMLGPPCTVIFGIAAPCSVCSVLAQ